MQLLGKGVSFHLAAPGFTNTAMVWASRDDTVSHPIEQSQSVLVGKPPH